MKERPIIMSAESVRAILAGAKTQTRQVVKPVKLHADYGTPRWDEAWIDTSYEACLKVPFRDDSNPDDQTVWRHYADYMVGDRLWVREAFRVKYDARYNQTWITSKDEDRILACGSSIHGQTGISEGLRSPIHMPRWASRITLEVTGVRVERVREISDADIKAEGWQKQHDISDDPEVHHDAARDWWMDHWNAINGKKHPWESNPWVWVIEFKRINP